ncbi:MAG: glycosyltransferase [Candidatus Obscuribacterales bacterium]|nr:glycosyltransferase [Steroidobacteraceae bacterium]
MLIDRGIHVPIEVAPTGIDRALYSSGVKARGRENFGLRASDEVVGHLGRLSSEKNLSFLVESMLRLMKARPAVKFLLVGEGDRLDWAKAQFAEASMSHRLVSPGLLAGQAIADAYAVMDIFAFTSKTDTQGLVLAEAMAAGVPIVALDAPGARDCVADQIAGLLLPSNVSETEFAHVIELLLKDNARRQTLSHGALEASRRFSLPQCVKRLQAIYERASAVYRQDDKKDIDPDLSSDHSDVEWSPFWEKISSAFRTLSSRSNSDLIG